MTAEQTGCAQFQQVRRQSRRDLLVAGGTTLFGLNLSQLLAAEAAPAAGPRSTARSVILLYQWGGPSHLETFDMKPDGPAHARGEFRPIASSLDGLQVCEHLPRFARVMDRVSLVRSMHHEFKHHNPPGYYGLTGHAPPIDDQRLRDTPDLFPHYGSVIDRLAPAPAEIPSFVAMPAVIRDGSPVPGQHGSFLGKSHDPLLITADPNRPDFRLPELSLPESISAERLKDRKGLLKMIDAQVGLSERQAAARGIGMYHERAFSMLSSPRVKQAFDLEQEPQKVRDEYGRTTFGQGALLARRLVEIGVRLVTVYYCRPTGGFIWDTHKQNFPELKDLLLPTTDQTVPALLTDLEQRGLLDETLVIWTGEFGRTPQINKDAGRDHWPQCYSAILAGGGMKRGFVYGASDSEGAHPVENPVRPENIAGTLYRALGIDPGSIVYDLQNRPLAIGGEAIGPLFA